MSGLDVWVIFHRPADFPDTNYVVACQRVSTDGIDGIVHLPHRQTCETLDEARAYVQEQAPGSVRLERDPDDDAVILETWI